MTIANFSFIPGSTKNWGVKSCISFSVSSRTSGGNSNFLCFVAVVGLNLSFLAEVVGGVGWKEKMWILSVVIGVGANSNVVWGDSENAGLNEGAALLKAGLRVGDSLLKTGLVDGASVLKTWFVERGDTDSALKAGLVGGILSAGFEVGDSGLKAVGALVSKTGLDDGGSVGMGVDER